MSRPIDTTKKANIKCEHCEYYTPSWDKSRSNMKDDGDCSNPDSPRFACCVNYWNRCKHFEWSTKLVYKESEVTNEQD